MPIVSLDTGNLDARQAVDGVLGIWRDSSSRNPPQLLQHARVQWNGATVDIPMTEFKILDGARDWFQRIADDTTDAQERRDKARQIAASIAAFR